jgi:hypothetical protein
LSDSDLSGAPELIMTDALAQQIAASIWPDQLVLESGYMKYRGQKAFALRKDSGLIIFPGARSNHYFVTTALNEETYTMDGKLAHWQYNVKSILKSLHERGWMGTRFGTWLADVVAAAMVFFSISGLIMWSVPKIRKLHGRWRARSVLPLADVN